VAEFLTDAWIDALDSAGAHAVIDRELRLVIQQIVHDREGGDVAYVVRVSDGHISVRRGRADDADVTFTQDRVTALAIHRGELSAQAAFLDGRLRLGGDLRAVIDRAGALATIDDVFAATRA
jgi:predicted lipid carrier protein YhbT